MKNLVNHIRAYFARPVFANVATGTHAGGITKNLEQAASTRYLLGKPGSSVAEVNLCGAADQPLGVITDEGEAGDPVNVALLIAASTTLLMIASEPIAAGSRIYTDANGKVQNEPAAPGDYYEVGIALTAASANGDAFEVCPSAPRKTKVLSAFSGTAATDITALGAALSDAPDKIIVLS